MKKKLSGFTLLEMLVVLFIISLLLLLFVPKLMSQKKAQPTRAMLLLSKLLRHKLKSLNWIMDVSQRKVN